MNALLKEIDKNSTITSAQLALAQASLSEVKELTEYQDQKSNRLLTIVAFLTAAAGALFAKFFDAYPLIDGNRVMVLEGAIAANYLVFALFLFFVACGALVTFHATLTRFVWDDQTADDSKLYDVALSYLFYKSIIQTSPVAWSRAFVGDSSKPVTEQTLRNQYYKNYIIESYLVAAKFGDKLRFLEPAQRLLQWAIRFLIVWLLSVFIVVAIVPREQKNASTETTENRQSEQRSESTGANNVASQPIIGLQHQEQLQDHSHGTQNTSEVIASGTKPVSPVSGSVHHSASSALGK
uniref:Uncharacterized protein n=1 Tax=Burkholderia sp. (strain CCGE1003) TaxID=640512 RepID=E1T3W7_BURSG